MGILVISILAVLGTIILGYFAARHGDFNEADNKQLAKLTMKYALPLSIFIGIWETPRGQLSQYGPLAFWILATMVVAFVIFFIYYRYGMKIEQSGSALLTLSVANASVPFIGSALLPIVFSAKVSAIIIGIYALFSNLITIPLALALVDKQNSIGRKIVDTFKNPLVFAPFAAFFLSFLGIPVPAHAEIIFLAFGKAASGIALFSIGITLFTNRVVFNKLVAQTVVFHNIVIPGLLLAIMSLLNLPHGLIKMIVITMALPSPAMPVTIAIRYRIREATIASTQLISTIASAFTIYLFMLLV